MLPHNLVIGWQNQKDSSNSKYHNMHSMRRYLFFTIFFISITDLSAQEIIGKDTNSFPIDTLAHQIPFIEIHDYSHIINEDSIYLFTIDFIRKIKNAYYIGAHTMLMGRTIHVKIIEPTLSKINKNKICVGKSYEMQLLRYYPYPLSHSLDYYRNYNFLFGEKVVSLQSTYCLNYIFTTENLNGLQYINEKMNNNKLVPNYFVDSVIFIILHKDNEKIRQIVEMSSVISCQKKFAFESSIINHNNPHCFPPYNLKHYYRMFKRKIFGFEKEDILLYLITDNYFYEKYSTFLNIDSLKIVESRIVFSFNTNCTYRVIWSLYPKQSYYITYLSFNWYNNTPKLVGISSFLFSLPSKKEKK